MFLFKFLFEFFSKTKAIQGAKTWFCLGTKGLCICLCILTSALKANEIIITNFNGFMQSQSNMVQSENSMFPYFKQFTSGEAGNYFGFNFLEEEQLIEQQLKQQMLQYGSSALIYNTANNNNNDGFIGSALSFSNVSQEFFLPVPQALLPASKMYTGSFSIELLVRPQVMAREVQFYSVEKYVHKIKEKGNTELFIIGASAGIPYVNLENLFHFKNSKFSYRLQSSTPLQLKKWTHLKVTFSNNSGLLQFWQDGEVVDFIYATKTGRSSETIYLPALLSKLPAFVELGKKYIGEIDEVYTSTLPNSPSVLKNVSPLRVNNIGFASTYTSKVFRLKPYSKVNSVTLLNGAFEKNNIFLKVCYSKKYFITFLELPANSKCQPLTIGQTLNQEEEALYYQFHLLIKSPNRKKIMGFNGFHINYSANNPPFAPKFVRAEALADGSFLLVWQRSAEEDIKGYTVYYSQIPFTKLTGSEKQMDVSLNSLEVSNNTKSLNLQYHYTFLNPNAGEEQTNEKMADKSVVLGTASSGNNSAFASNLAGQGMYYFAIRSYDRVEENSNTQKVKRFSKLSNVVSAYLRL